MREKEPAYQHQESEAQRKRINAEIDPSSGLIVEAGAGISDLYEIEITSDNEALLHVVDNLEVNEAGLFGLTYTFAFIQAEPSSRHRWSVTEESPTQLKKADRGWLVTKKGRLEMTPMQAGEAVPTTETEISTATKAERTGTQTEAVPNVAAKPEVRGIQYSPVTPDTGGIFTQTTGESVFQMGFDGGRGAMVLSLESPISSGDLNTLNLFRYFTYEHPESGHGSYDIEVIRPASLDSEDSGWKVSSKGALKITPHKA